jgi:hypothetical protein
MLCKGMSEYCGTTIQILQKGCSPDLKPIGDCRYKKIDGK